MGVNACHHQHYQAASQTQNHWIKDPAPVLVRLHHYKCFNDFLCSMLILGSLAEWALTHVIISTTRLPPKLKIIGSKIWLQF